MGGNLPSTPRRRMRAGYYKYDSGEVALVVYHAPHIHIFCPDCRKWVPRRWPVAQEKKC